MNSINFDNPWLLFIGLGLLILLIASFAYAVRKENVSHKNITSFVMHILMVILITLTLAHTTYERMMTETNIYVVCDLSYSTHINHDKIDKAIDMVRDNAPKNTKVGVIGFGKEPVLHVRCGEMMKSIKSCQVDESETNIAKALEYAGSLFDDSVIKRIVIITDGLDNSDSNIVSAVNDLSKDKVYVDAIFVDSNIVSYEESYDSKGNLVTKGEKEVQVSKLDYNERVYINSNQVVTALINSTNELQAIVKLYANGVVLNEQTVLLSKGLNTYSFDLKTNIKGETNYDFVVECEDDSLRINNEMSFTQIVDDELRVLYISGNFEEKNLAPDLFDKKVKVDYYFMQPGENMIEAPYSVEDICKYDEIVLSNVNVRQIMNDATFISSLEKAVGRYGKSLITLGNTYIGTVASGDDSEKKNTSLDVLSEILPVKYGNQSDDTRNIAIVLDVSRSMNGESLLTNAKKFVTEFLNTLSAKDSVTLIGISEMDHIVCSRTSATKENIAEIIRKMNTELTPSNGTYLEKALKRINEEILSDPSITNKEIIVVSDGYERGTVSADANGLSAGAKSLVSYGEVCKKNGFHITTCKVGQIHDDGYNVLKQLASPNSCYMLFNEFNLKLDQIYENVFETKFENVNLPINLKLANDENVKGVNLSGSINGIYASRPKAGSKVVYETTLDTADKTLTMPILAYKYYGNGKVSSITTDIYDSKWGSIISTTQDGKKLLSNIVDNSIPEVKNPTPFTISVNRQGSSTLVTIDCATFQQNAKPTLIVKDEKGNVSKYVPTFDSTNYVCYIDNLSEGVNTITFDYIFGKNHYVSETKYHVNYSSEYDRFETYRASNLRKMVLNGELVNLGEELKLENIDSKTLKFVYDFTPALMIATVSLFVLDIALRKLTMKDIKSLFGKGKEGVKNA